ncbi:MAG: CotH kinase family protein [Aeromicrobium sp.]
MKTLKTTLALITAALLPLALLATPSSAVTGTDDQEAVSGNLRVRQPGTTTEIFPPFEEGQEVTLYANFSGGVRNVNFYRETTPGSNTWTKIGTDEANSYGNAYLDYTVVAGDHKIFAEDVDDLETETDSLTVTATSQSTTAVLDAPTPDGKTWTAHFGAPPVPGKATQLQYQQIYTDEVSDVDAVNPEAKKTERMGPWKTIATSTQNANGDSTFNLSSPYPYRVAHKYRAVSGTAKSCDPSSAIDVTAPTCQTFGLPPTTPKDTGLSALYFNSNEGHAIDTRTRYYEGEFSMTSSVSTGCGAIAPVKFSVMKGRGNYSWSFKRKSYTLKLGKSTDLCGMGASKKYALVSQDYDKSFLRNALAGYIGKKFTNMAWTPDSKPVDLYLNGKYLGNYLLIERIAIAADRVNVPELKGGEKCLGVTTPDNQTTDPNHPNNIDPCKTGGYLLEWDFRKGADYNPYLGSDSGYVGVKDPENDRDREDNITTKGISSQQKSYINGYLNTVDSNLRGSGFTNDSTGWKKYIDQASAVDYYIAMEYMKPVDGNMWASVYMYKQRDSAAGANDGKLFFGPLWDFDLAAGSANRAGNVVSPSSFYLRNNLGVSAQQSSKTWFNRLNEDPEFRAAVKARWNAVKGSIDTDEFIDTQKGIIADSANTSYASAPNGASHSYRISKYQIIKSSWSSDVSYLKSWASSRKSWLSSNF